MKAKLINKMGKREYKVVRVNSKEFELDNGDIYPHAFELDDDITVEEFQKLLDGSKSMILNHIKNLNQDNE